MTVTRPTALWTALTLFVLLGLVHLAVPYMPDADKIPAIVRYGDVGLGIASLIAGYGLWKLFSWAKTATIVLAALNIVSATPGVFYGPNQTLQIIAALYVALSVVIIALVFTCVQRGTATARV
ncbi:MAG TPA: hypothetical protein VF808_06040 [Ktedonobacterales bacterium]